MQQCNHCPDCCGACGRGEATGSAAPQDAAGADPGVVAADVRRGLRTAGDVHSAHEDPRRRLLNAELAAGIKAWKPAATEKCLFESEWICPQLLWCDNCFQKTKNWKTDRTGKHSRQTNQNTQRDSM